MTRNKLIGTGLVLLTFINSAFADKNDALKNALDTYWTCHINAQDKASKGNAANIDDQRCEKALYAALEKHYGINQLNDCEKSVVDYYYNCQSRLNEKYLKGNLSSGASDECIEGVNDKMAACKEQLSDDMQMTTLIASPPVKLKACALKGVLAYQTALSLNFLFGRKDLKRSQAEAYAWSLIVGHRIQQMHNLTMLALHRHSEDMLRQKINNPTVLYNGKRLAIKIWEKYGSKWSIPTIPEKLPVGCEILG